MDSFTHTVLALEKLMTEWGAVDCSSDAVRAAEVRH